MNAHETIEIHNKYRGISIAKVNPKKTDGKIHIYYGQSGYKLSIGNRCLTLDELAYVVKTYNSQMNGSKAATDHGKDWNLVKDFFNSSADFEAKRGRQIGFFANDTDHIGYLTCKNREWDFYLTRMYAQLACSLKNRHGIVLAPYPLTGRWEDAGDGETTYIEIRIKED